MNMDDAEYMVDIRDTGTFIVQGARASHHGLDTILKKFTTMDHNDRAEFMHAVKDNGSWEHHSTIRSFAEPCYDIFASELVEEPEREKIDWEKLDVEIKARLENAGRGWAMMKAFDDFFAERGGRDRYFITEPNGSLIPREYLAD